MANKSINSSGIVNVEDLRRMAQRRIPKAVFDYLDGGAESEITLSENCRAFRDVTFRPRGAVAFSGCNLSTTVVGQEISVPFMLAPVGYSRLMNPEGEIAAASAVSDAGGFTFSPRFRAIGWKR
jgi:L-lactate dehydrogenase (cytochrome)